MALPTNQELELLQLINRFRADPAGEYARLITSASPPTAVLSTITSAITFFGVDLALFQQQLQGLTAAAPLAWSTLLEDAAAGHSQKMIALDTQSHQVAGEAGLGARITAAGYSYSLVGENIYAYSSSPLYAHAGFVIDWGFGTGGMQTPAGHRNNLLNASYSEIGIDITAEDNPSTSVGPLVVTQDLGASPGYHPQVLGVVFDDADGDNFYDAGEGISGVSVTAVGSPGTFATTSWSSGGYQFELPMGSYTVTFSGGGLSGQYATSVTMGTANVQVNAEAAQFNKANSAPVVSAADYAAAQSGQTIAAAALFTASDIDSDTLYYNFWDGSSAATSGYWLVGATKQLTDTVIGVAAADLGTVSFVTGTTADLLYVRVSDGSVTTDWAKFTVTPPPLPVAAIGADMSVSEAAVRISITVSLDAAPAGPVTVPWSVVDGTASVAGHDMPSAQSGNVSFTVGGPLSQTVTLLVNDEAHKQEGSEAFTVKLGTPVGATLGRAEATVTLIDHYVPPPAVPLAMTNTTTKTASTPAPVAYAGPLTYLDSEFVYLGADSVNVVANAPNMFLRSAGGNDALTATDGQNVLDAGGGSNFLTGGSGADTFFLDTRGATLPLWSTIVGLGAGDAVTVWGVSQANSSFTWLEGAGAPGFTGLTVHTATGGGPVASLTLAGLVDADRGNGRLSVLFGTEPGSGSNYMFIFANS